MEWWIFAFIKILIINIILSGDNAIIIAMASKNLPEHQRKLAIFWGAFGAILLRILLTLVAIYLLKIPFLMTVGAILLLWIAVKLMIEKEDHSSIEAHHHLGNAVMTIIIADFVMSLDNVIAITAVAKGDFFLISIGLLLSIPLIIWGSTLILKMINKFPSLIYIGAAILGFTAGEMLLHDPKLSTILSILNNAIHYLPYIAALFVVAIGWGVNQLKRENSF